MDGVNQWERDGENNTSIGNRHTIRSSMYVVTFRRSFFVYLFTLPFGFSLWFRFFSLDLLWLQHLARLPRILLVLMVALVFSYFLPSSSTSFASIVAFRNTSAISESQMPTISSRDSEQTFFDFYHAPNEWTSKQTYPRTFSQKIWFSQQ